jgi:hypothetical protein
MLPTAITRRYPRPKIDLGFRRPSDLEFSYWHMLDEARRAVSRLEWSLLLNSAGVGSSKKEER